MALTSYSADEKQVALLRLEREQARNAITEMLVELLAHLSRARGDTEARVVVISSNDHPGLSALTSARSSTRTGTSTAWSSSRSSTTS